MDDRDTGLAPRAFATHARRRARHLGIVPVYAPSLPPPYIERSLDDIDAKARPMSPK